MEQRTEDWLEWRRNGIGSSDAPVIMKMSPWATPFQLWEEKTGKTKTIKKSNWAMDRGNTLEPKARAWYELHSDIEMPAQLLIHPEHQFLRASLDGYNSSKKRILEIKCPGKEDHAIALKGKVPEKYIWQLVHQLMAANADSVDYLSFDGKAGVIVPFERDLKLEKKLLPEEMKFWELVQKKIPPELLEKDLMEVTDPEDIVLFEEMKKAKAIADAADEQVEKFVSQIKKKYPNGQIHCAGYQLMKIFRSGTVDLEKIPQLKGVDLDQYRKPGSFSLTLRPKKAG